MTLTHADPATLTHADLRRLVQHAHIERAMKRHAPPCFELLPSGDLIDALHEVLLERPSEALLDEQAHHLADLLSHDVGLTDALTSVLVDVQVVDETTDAEAVLALVRPFLQGLEWSGRVAEAPYYMGGPTPGYLPGCPTCHGLREPNSGFNESAVGHRPTCQLRQVLSAVEIALGASPSSPSSPSSPTPTSTPQLDGSGNWVDPNHEGRDAMG